MSVFSPGNAKWYGSKAYGNANFQWEYWLHWSPIECDPKKRSNTLSHAMPFHFGNVCMSACVYSYIATHLHGMHLCVLVFACSYVCQSNVPLCHTHMHISRKMNKTHPENDVVRCLYLWLTHVRIHGIRQIDVRQMLWSIFLVLCAIVFKQRAISFKLHQSVHHNIMMIVQSPEIEYIIFQLLVDRKQ